MTPVAELSGAELALWVARALKMDDVCIAFDVCRAGKHGTAQRIDFEPHTDWAHGGPLIEKHRIEIGAPTESGTFAGIWTANTEWGGINGWQGPTPLAAAMRALVASVYGDTVPDEVAP